MGSILCRLLLDLLVAEAAESDFFQTFPVVDEAQHAVFDAESVQIIGTASAGALEKHLPAGWKLLRLGDAQTKEIQTQALMSVGVGDFRNTSCGPYRELAIAVPACEGEEIYLDCGSFMRCQEKLPHCSHMFMLRSFASTEAAVRSAHAAGIAAEFSSRFDFSVNTSGKSSRLAFAVGSASNELLMGEVEVVKNEESGGRGLSNRGGYRLQLFASEGGRHICAFPNGLEAAPARMVDDIHGGDFFHDIDFQPEGVLHLPVLQVMRLPTWGKRGQSKHTSLDSLGSLGSLGRSHAPLDKEQRQGTVSSLTPKQTKQTVASPAPPAPPAPAPPAPTSQSVNFMDLVNELNEGKEKPRGELSEIDLLQAHQERVPNQNAHHELLAKVAEQNPRAGSSTNTDRHLPNAILQEL